jgi:hypothetical protein
MKIIQIKIQTRTLEATIQGSQMNSVKVFQITLKILQLQVAQEGHLERKSSSEEKDAISSVYI